VTLPTFDHASVMLKRAAVAFLRKLKLQAKSRSLYLHTATRHVHRWKV
jgi:hypothetical protein